MNAREVAYKLLQEVPQSHRLADELLGDALERSGLSLVDRGLVTELFYGCLRQKLALDFVISRAANHPPRQPVAVMLHLGLYQLLFLDKIPAHAAVHETVELAKRHASVSEAKFVNAILRRATKAMLDGAEPWILLSHPRWLWDRWVKRWGREETMALCEWNNSPPPVCVRLNTLKAPSLPADVPAEPTAHPLCYQVRDQAGLFHTKSWADGALYVQDPSTLLAVDALDPQPGESVLDMCAAPGGKTTYIAQKMQNRGEVIAADMSNPRLQRVIENCRRLGVTIVATMPCEGTRLDRCLRGAHYDRVLVDAPCSNTGVLRRRVDLRWRIEEKEIARHAELQAKLLRMGASLTKPGGVLVYSTCSLEREENEGVTGQFAASHPQFELESTKATFPPREKMDGAFVVRWRRKS